MRRAGAEVATLIISLFDAVKEIVKRLRVIWCGLMEWIVVQCFNECRDIDHHRTDERKIELTVDLMEKC